MVRMASTIAGLSVAVACVAAIPAWSAPNDPAPDGRIRLDETVISGSQELPKVLYIVPWQDPSGMPSLELSPEFTEHEVFRRLYPPAYRREIEYYELLDASEGKE
ncbi:MAG: hypothetical protein HC809_10955 [Gammaproteobacteria bacterium]|nr:hypothetical protein [Gammaproteobacteria bacterium]